MNNRENSSRGQPSCTTTGGSRCMVMIIYYDYTVQVLSAVMKDNSEEVDKKTVNEYEGMLQ